MLIFRLTGLLTTALILGACVLPGMEFTSGGSSVWQEVGENEGSLQIFPITPSLVTYFANKKSAVEKNQTHQLSTYNTPTWQYRIGPGDVLGVIVWDHPELTNPAGTTQSVASSGRVVEPDGTIYYPHLGELSVVGKTTTQVRQELAIGLSKVIESPQVDVRVIEFRSQFVNVVGDVELPCKVYLNEIPLTLIDAMNQCQTIRPTVGNRSLVLERSGKKHSVNLNAVYTGKSPLIFTPLNHRDILYVEDDRWNRVFVVGEVNQQASLNIPVSGLTLADALNAERVSGLNQNSVDASDIYVFRGGMEHISSADGNIVASNYRPKIFHLNAKSADALLLADMFELQPRDIVYASSANLVSYNRAASLIFPTINTLLQTGILFDRL